MRRLLALGALAATVVTTACDSLGQAMSAHTDVVARAGGLEFTVDEAAGILAQNPRLPAEPEVVDAIANLWVDYVLLASAANHDSTLANLDLGPVVDPILEQQLFVKLNEKVITADTTLSDQDLRALYEREKPGMQVRARHVLIRVAPDATPEQREAAQQRAGEIRTRAASGEDFAKLAEEHSEDPGSAEQGGDLGFFGRGQMVAPFDAAAFALDVGEISEVVETPFGYHVIKVEEQKLPDFELVKDQFRQQAQAQRVMEAQEAYMKQLTEPLEIKVQEGAAAVAKDLARKPATKLSSRANSRALVSYKGGALTAGEYLDFVRMRTNASQQAQLAAGSDQDLETVLEGLTRNEILVGEAKRLGLEVTKAERDSLSNEIREQLVNATVATGFAAVESQQNETPLQAIERRVSAFLEGVVRGEVQVLGLGPLSYSLRADSEPEIFARAFPNVVKKLQESRPVLPSGMPEGAQPGAPQQ